MSILQDHYFRWCNYVILFVGAALRLVIYGQNRSLFIDEACLSYQIIGRDYAGLFERMDYQYAPPFFSGLVKVCTQLIGANEYALRFVPLLAGLLSLWLFYRLGRQILGERWIIFPLLLYTLGMPFVQYSTEVKQYASDGFFTIILLLLAWCWTPHQLTTRQIAIWGLIGSLVIWWSMPIVFLLFGIGGYYVWFAWRQQQWTRLGQWILVSSSWLASFGLYYFTLLRQDIDSDYLQQFHNNYFLPLFPSSATEWAQWTELLLGLFRTSIGKTVIALGFGILSFIMGTYWLFRRQGAWLWLLVMPLVTMLFASALRQYSLYPRLTLFVMPQFILVMGLGLKALWSMLPRWSSLALLIVMGVIVINLKSYQYFFQPFQIEELRPVLKQVQVHRQANEAVYLHYQANHAFTFYQDYYQGRAQTRLEDVQRGRYEDQPAGILNQWRDVRVWLIFSHSTPQERAAFTLAFEKDKRILKRIEMPGASAFLFE